MGVTTKIAIFKGKKVRKTIYNNGWWFSVVDVVEALTDSVNPCLLERNESSGEKPRWN